MQVTTLVLRPENAKPLEVNDDYLKELRDELINMAGYYMSLGLATEWQECLEEAGEITHRLVKLQQCGY